MKIAVLTSFEQTVPALQNSFNEVVSDDELSFYIFQNLGKELSRPQLKGVDLLFIDIADVQALDWDVIEEYNLKHAHTVTFLVVKENSENVILKAMQIGARDVLRNPIQAERLREVYLKAKHRIEASQTRKKTGQLIAFIPCKGGSGASFVSSNLSYVVSELTHRRVLFIDLDLNYGDASYYISDNEETRGLIDIIRSPVLDKTLLDSASIVVGENINILRSPSSQEHAIGITPEQVDRLITVAIESYDFVFVDLERALDPISIAVLDRADKVFAVMQTMLPYVRGMKRLIDTFRALGYSNQKIALIANRFDKTSDFTIEKIETVLGQSFYKILPNDFSNATRSTNTGIPLYKLNRSSQIVDKLIEITEELVGPIDSLINKESSTGLLKRFSSIFN